MNATPSASAPLSRRTARRLALAAAVSACLVLCSGPGVGQSTNPAAPTTGSSSISQITSPPAAKTAPAAKNAPAATPSGNVTPGVPSGKNRLREGMRLVDQVGYFRAAGDRIAFFTNNDANRLIGLENLNLQRVATAIAEQPKGRLWKVTGTVTEYRGENFLLIDRAILESWEKSQAKTP